MIVGFQDFLANLLDLWDFGLFVWIQCGIRNEFVCRILGHLLQFSVFVGIGVRRETDVRGIAGVRRKKSFRRCVLYKTATFSYYLNLTLANVMQRNGKRANCSLQQCVVWTLAKVVRALSAICAFFSFNRVLVTHRLFSIFRFCFIRLHHFPHLPF